MTVRGGLLLLGAIGALVLAWAYTVATSEPVVRHAAVELLPWTGGRSQVRALLISDIHVAGPDMPPERLARIVAKINALQPDLVLIAGDMVSDKEVATKIYDAEHAMAPLRGIRSRLGVFAVLGNHDYSRGAEPIRAALARANIKVLDNEAARAGPLVIGGLDDPFTGRDDLPATLRAMRSRGGVPILLSHSPDPFPELPAEIGLMVAGHTHCGQIRLPVIGAVSYMSEHGERYACGVVREGSKTLIVGAGLGTSLLPLRLGAAPDMWMIRITEKGALGRRAMMGGARHALPLFFEAGIQGDVEWKRRGSINMLR